MAGRKNESSASGKPQSSSSTSVAPTCTISPLENEELKRIDVASKGRDSEEALKLAENACRLFKDCSFFHRLHGGLAYKLYVWFKHRGVIDRGLLYKAAVSSLRAIALFPNSLEYQYFHAFMRCFVARVEGKGFDKVIELCERARDFENPEEPFWDLYAFVHQRLVKPKNRTKHMRKCICRLITRIGKEAQMDPRQIQSSAEKMVRYRSHPEEPMAKRPRRKINMKLKAEDCKHLLQIRDYWNFMSLRMKRNLFKARVDDLKKHCRKLLKDVALDCNILDRIIPVFWKTKTWSFYLCYRCRENFFDVDELMQHGCIHTITNRNPLWPSFVNNALVDDILNIVWKPYDDQEALRMIEKEHLTVEEVLQNFPLSDDPERTQCIDSIQDKLRCMIEKKILCNSHIERLRWKALKFVPSKFMNHIYMIDLHLCIGLLQLDLLKEVLQSLEDIVDACGQPWNTLSHNNDDVIPKVKSPSFTVFYSFDSIILDTCFFKNNKWTYGDAEVVEYSDERIDADNLLSSMLCCQHLKELLVDRIRLLENNERRGKSAMLMDDFNFNCLSTNSKNKADLLSHIKAIQIVDNLCSEVLEKMVDTDEPSSSFIALLNKHQEELSAVGTNPQSLESVVINSIITATKSVACHQDQCLYQVKSVMTTAIMKHYDEINKKVNKVDAQMMQILSVTEEINQMLRSLSFLEYEEIVSILLISFLQVSLEHKVEKDAMENIAAALEDLSKQENYDGKMKKITGVDSSKITNDVKKRKSKRKGSLKMGLDGESKDLDLYQEKDTGTSYAHSENVVSSEDYLRQEDILGNDKIIVEEYNYFLNVILKSLWHLRCFRNSFKNSVRSHNHVDDPCVFCNLNDIFVSLDKGARGGKMNLISHHTLTILSILKNSYGDCNFLTEMNVSSKAFAVILLLVHVLSISTSGELGARSEESVHLDHYDCRCLAHTVFGMDIHSEESRYTSWFYKVDAHALCRMQGMNQVDFFNHLFKYLLTEELPTPHGVLAVVINWHKECGGVEYIKSILAAINTHIDLNVVCHGADNANKYSLVCMICYCRPKLQCFTYSDENEQWTILDGETVKETGLWNDVKQVCITKNLQPEILFFEPKS